MRIKLLLLLLLAPAAAGAQEEPPLELPEAPAGAVRYSADFFEYYGSTGGADARIRLEGNVELVESTRTIRADEAFVDLQTGEARARGNVELDDGLNRLRGERGTYDLKSRAGSLQKARAEYPPWRVWSREASVDAERRARFEEAFFTSCEAEEPHYHFRAGKLRVIPKKRLWATNVRLHLGPVPIFYTPFLWKSLRPKRLLSTRFSPAYDKRNGAILRTTTEFGWLPSLRSLLFLDYHTSQGLGVGSEVNFKRSENARGALYGYGISEDGGEERWTVLGDYFQAFNSTYSAQGRLQAQGDPEVNNHYVRSNAFRVAGELVNGGAFVRQTALTTTRLSYSRLDTRVEEPGGFGRFEKTRESLPRLDFQTAPLSIKRVPVLWTVTGFADNSYDRARGFQQRSAGGGLEATRVFLVRRGMSLTPRAGVREVYEDKREVATSFGSSRTLRDVFTGFYDGAMNLRVDTPLGAWDADYAFTARTRPDGFARDAGAPDYGIERSLATIQDTLRPSRRVLLRLRTGYDFRRFRDADPGFRDRVQPFTADLNLFPARGWQFSVRSDYQLEEGHRAFLAQAEWGDRLGTFMAVAGSWARGRADEPLASVEGGYAPGAGTWRVEGALRALTRHGGGLEVSDFRLFEKEVSLVKDFHDFHTRILGRVRPGGVKEILARIDLRIRKPEESRRELRRNEREWFPWRRTGREDDRE